MFFSSVIHYPEHRKFSSTTFKNAQMTEYFPVAALKLHIFTILLRVIGVSEIGPQPQPAAAAAGPC